MFSITEANPLTIALLGGYYLLSRVVLIVDDWIRTGTNPALPTSADHWSGGRPPSSYYICPIVGDLFFLYTLHVLVGLLLTKAVVGTAKKFQARAETLASKQMDTMSPALRPTEALEFLAAEAEVEEALRRGGSALAR